MSKKNPMPSKRELITVLVDRGCDYAIDEKIATPEELQEMKKKHNVDINKIVWFVETYLCPAYDQKLLKEYVYDEIRLIMSLREKAGMPKRKVTEKHLLYLCELIEKVIKVIRIKGTKKKSS